MERGLEHDLVVRPVQVGAQIPAAVGGLVVFADHEQDLAAGVGQRHPGMEIGDMSAAVRLYQVYDALVPARFSGAAGVLVFHMYQHRLVGMLVQEVHEAVEQVREHEGRQLLPPGTARRVAAAGRVAQRGDAVMNRKVLQRTARRRRTQVEHADTGRQLFLDRKFLRLDDLGYVHVAEYDVLQPFEMIPFAGHAALVFIMRAVHRACVV